VGGDIAGAAGVGVLAPRAADVARAFEDHEVVDPLLLQAHAQGEPREPGTDRGDADVCGERVCVRGGDGSFELGHGVSSRVRVGAEPTVTSYGVIEFREQVPPSSRAEMGHDAAL
jgi:hypothetical protein